jgi:hypothetical protein
MGKKKWCFGREDVVCLTKDCPYMSDCIQMVWRKKMARLIGRGTLDVGGTIPKLKSTLKGEEKVARKARKRATSTPVATPGPADLP